MVTGISVSKAQKSKVKRLSFLPRIDFSIDLLGKRIDYTQAPISELLYNLYKQGFSKENFIKIVTAQIGEARNKSYSSDELVSKLIKIKEDQ